MSEGGGRHTEDGSDNPSSGSRPQMDMEAIMARQQQMSLIPAELTALVMSRTEQYPLPMPQRRAQAHAPTTQEVGKLGEDEEKITQSGEDQVGAGEGMNTMTKRPSLDTVDAPSYPPVQSVVATPESSPSGVPNPTSEVTSTLLIPFEPVPSAPKSKSIRLMVYTFAFFYLIFKKFVMEIGGLIFVAAAPPIATVFVGSMICKSFHYPYYEQRWASMVVPALLGSVMALAILYPASYFLRKPSALQYIFGFQPLRTFRIMPSDATRIEYVSEDYPVLFFYYPYVYLFSFLSLVLVAKVSRYPSGGRGPDDFLTVTQITRVAALGALPVSIVHFLVTPFAIGFWQWTQRRIDNWLARMTGKRETKYDVSILRRVCYQYTRWRKKSIDRRPREGLVVRDGFA